MITTTFFSLTYASIITILLAVASLICGVVYALTYPHSNYHKRCVIKGTASILFLIAALICGIQFIGKSPVTGIFLILAFFLCALGDILLAVVPMISKEKGTLCFSIASLSFLISHLCRTISICNLQTSFRFILLIDWAVFLMVLLYFVSYRKWIGENARFKFLYPYCACLGLVIGASSSMLFHEKTAFLFFLGALLFAISDFALFIHRFPGERGKACEGYIHYVVSFGYYLAQFLFLLGFAIIF